MRGIHRGRKWPVTRKMFPFDDVIMFLLISLLRLALANVVKHVSYKINEHVLQKSLAMNYHSSVTANHEFPFRSIYCQFVGCLWGRCAWKRVKRGVSATSGVWEASSLVHTRLGSIRSLTLEVLRDFVRTRRPFWMTLSGQNVIRNHR